LLWHITAIESILGQKNPPSGLTRILGDRLTKILGTTKDDKKRVRNTFNKLYGFRCDLVHGNVAVDKVVYGGRLVEARAFARQIALWMLQYLDHVAANLQDGASLVPSRDVLLQLVDTDEHERTVLKTLLDDLPDDFPKFSEPNLNSDSE